MIPRGEQSRLQDDDENIHGLRRRECWLTDSLQLSTLIHQLLTFSVSIAESAQCPLVRYPAQLVTCLPRRNEVKASRADSSCRSKTKTEPLRRRILLPWRTPCLRAEPRGRSE